MKLAVVGSRNYDFFEEFEQYLFEYLISNKVNLSKLEFVSGGADGVDTLIQKFADKYEYPIKVFEAEWKKYGSRAGPMRNSQIVSYCTHVLAFPAKDSVGTFDTIRKAKKKPTKIIYIE